MFMYYSLTVYICLYSRHSSAGSGAPWTHLRMPTTRTRLRWWSVWTVLRRCCSGPGKLDSTVSRAGRRVRPRNSPPPVWFSTTAKGRSLTCSLDVAALLSAFQSTTATDSDLTWCGRVEQQSQAVCVCWWWRLVGHEKNLNVFLTYFITFFHIDRTETDEWISWFVMI